jgi:hypothetical protein
MSYRIKFFLILSFCSCLASGQQVTVDAEDLNRKYPNEDFYYVYDRTEMNISIVNGKLDIYSDVSGGLFYRNDKANLYSRKSIYFYDETEGISNIEANSFFRQDNGRYKKVKVEETHVTKPMKGGIFYDDFKEIFFDYPSLRPASYSDYSYRVKYKDPYLLDPVYLSNNVTTGEALYSVTFPKEVNVRYIVYGDTSNIRFSSQDKGKLTTYTWKGLNIPSSRDIRQQGSYRKLIPHVIIYIDSYMWQGNRIPVLGNTHDLYGWFYSHIKNYTDTVHPELKALSDSLTRGLKTDEEKIGAIYYWVQANIRYIAFEYGLGGFVPRPAELVCNRRFGDCKDKSNVLYSLLRSAGFNVYHCWIGTKDLPYKYDEVRSPIAANHMIVGIFRKGKWSFLDGTSDNLPIDYPSSFIQGKEAMIGISRDSFLIVNVPIVEKNYNYRTDSLVLSVRNDSLVGNGHSVYGGLWRNAVVNSYFDVAEKDRTDELRSLFIFGSNKRKIDSLKFDGMDDFRDTLDFKYSISLPDHSRNIDDALYINLNLHRMLQDDEIEIEKQKSSETYKFRYVVNTFVKLNIPADYVIATSPGPSTYMNSKFGYKIAYERTENSVVMKKSIFIDSLEIPKEDFVQWNEMIKSLGDNYANVVVLKKK